MKPTTNTQHPTPDNQTTAKPRHEAAPKPSPSIYVASLADYNNGMLHGKWIDAARDPDEIYADITAILASSRQPDAEEWAIHDYEQFGSWKVDEYDSIEQVSRIAKGIADHGYAFSAWADLNERDHERISAFAAAYLGHYDSVETYAYQMAEDLGYTRELEDKLPEYVQAYVHIDYAAIARDLLVSGDIATVADPNGGLWLFRTDA